MSSAQRPTHSGTRILRARRTGRNSPTVRKTAGVILLIQREPGATLAAKPCSSPANGIAATEPTGPVTGMWLVRPTASSRARGMIRAEVSGGVCSTRASPSANGHSTRAATRVDAPAASSVGDMAAAERVAPQHDLLDAGLRPREPDRATPVVLLLADAEPAARLATGLAEVPVVEDQDVQPGRGERFGVRRQPVAHGQAEPVGEHDARRRSTGVVPPPGAARPSHWRTGRRSASMLSAVAAGATAPSRLPAPHAPRAANTVTAAGTIRPAITSSVSSVPTWSASSPSSGGPARNAV